MQQNRTERSKVITDTQITETSAKNKIKNRRETTVKTDKTAVGEENNFKDSKNCKKQTKNNKKIKTAVKGTKTTPNGILKEMENKNREIQQREQSKESIKTKKIKTAAKRNKSKLFKVHRNCPKNDIKEQNSCRDT